MLNPLDYQSGQEKDDTLKPSFFDVTEKSLIDLFEVLSELGNVYIIYRDGKFYSHASSVFEVDKKRKSASLIVGEHADSPQEAFNDFLSQIKDEPFHLKMKDGLFYLYKYNGNILSAVKAFDINTYMPKKLSLKYIGPAPKQKEKAEYQKKEVKKISMTSEKMYKLCKKLSPQIGDIVFMFEGGKILCYASGVYRIQERTLGQEYLVMSYGDSLEESFENFLKALQKEMFYVMIKGVLFPRIFDGKKFSSVKYFQ